jgi:hypothetical protein
MAKPFGSVLFFWEICLKHWNLNASHKVSGNDAILFVRGFNTKGKKGIVKKD